MQIISPGNDHTEMDFFQELFYIEELVTRARQESQPSRDALRNGDNDYPTNHEVPPKRESLKVEIEKRASLLSSAEAAFLQGIVDEGDDEQVEVAQERLAEVTPRLSDIQRGPPQRTGSAARRSSLALRQRNNSTHTAMMKAYAVQRFKNAGRKIMNLNKKFGSDRVKSLFSRNSDIIVEVPSDEENDSTDGTDISKHVKRVISPAKLEAETLEEDDEMDGPPPESSNSNSTFLLDRADHTGEPEVGDRRQDLRRTKSEGMSYNPWAQVDEDFNGIQFEFAILGTSADDYSATPHVLSPPLMHSIQRYLPFSKRGESFWLKYSLVRDGAAVSTFLSQLRGTKYAVMALETVDGEVMGGFTAEPWQFNRIPFGTGESFLWKMRHNRSTISDSVAEQARMESDIEVFRYSHQNRDIQICQSSPPLVALGGGGCKHEREVQNGVSVRPHEWGFGISFADEYLLEGTSSPCFTFDSPSLSTVHKDGSQFEVINLEVWALTPCLSVKEAEIMECRSMFLQRNMSLKTF